MPKKTWQIEAEPQKDRRGFSTFRYRARVMVVIEPLVVEPSAGGRTALGSALVDTGANGTSLDRQTALDCGFKQVGMGVHITADGKKAPKPIYRGTLKITGLL